ncbi:hypothetical protein RSJ42_15330 [Methanosarcina hadiensis]|uniref:hypothetical protein n=1 Tax=Methanosarcina hadiensis TaxID=3078083 RepID=UPI0039772DC8
MIKSTHLHKRRKEHALIITSLSILILVLLTILPAAAAVNSWEISPEKPVHGDTLRIKGSASPDEEVEVQVTFEKAVEAFGGEYEYTLENVKIPEGFNNRFTVEASEARNLNVRVKMLIWVTKSSEASGNTATVTQSSVPPGTYQIKMDGDARGGTSTVNLKITAVQRVKADSDGDFSYSYNTKSVPPGDFEVSVGGIKKKVTLQQGKTSVVVPGNEPQKTEPAKEEATSETPEKEDTEAVLSPDQGPEQGEEVQKPQPVEEAGLSVDKIYLLGGMVAAVLILILYSRRNKEK